MFTFNTRPVKLRHVSFCSPVPPLNGLNMDSTGRLFIAGAGFTAALDTMGGIPRSLFSKSGVCLLAPRVENSTSSFVVAAGSDKFTFSAPAGSYKPTVTFVTSNFESTAQKGIADWPTSYHAFGLNSNSSGNAMGLQSLNSGTSTSAPLWPHWDMMRLSQSTSEYEGTDNVSVTDLNLERDMLPRDLFTPTEDAMVLPYASESSTLSGGGGQLTPEEEEEEEEEGGAFSEVLVHRSPVEDGEGASRALTSYLSTVQRQDNVQSKSYEDEEATPRMIPLQSSHPRRYHSTRSNARNEDRRTTQTYLPHRHSAPRNYKSQAWHQSSDVGVQTLLATGYHPLDEGMTRVVRHVGWNGHRNLYQVGKKQGGTAIPMERTESDPTSNQSAGFFGQGGHRSPLSRPLRTEGRGHQGKVPAQSALAHREPSMLNPMPKHEKRAVLIERNKSTPTHTQYRGHSTFPGRGGQAGRLQQGHSTFRGQNSTLSGEASQYRARPIHERRSNAATRSPQTPALNAEAPAVGRSQTPALNPKASQYIPRPRTSDGNWRRGPQTNHRNGPNL